MSEEYVQNPWYCNGLKFSCTGCGKCCSGIPGYVWVTEEEMHAIAKKLNLSFEVFTKKYIRQKQGRYALLEKRALNGDYDCIFLNDKKCSIYDVRPTQCRTYPWWKKNLQSKEAWENTKEECEGINDKAPLVSLETIMKEGEL